MADVKKLEDLDPIFAAPPSTAVSLPGAPPAPAARAVREDRPTEEGPGVGFASVPGATTVVPNDSSKSEFDISSRDLGAAGALLGGAARYLTNTPGVSPEEIARKEAALKELQTRRQAALQAIAHPQATPAGTIDAAFKEVEAARAQFNIAQQRMAELRAQAAQIGALPDAAVAPTEIAGQKPALPGQVSAGAERHADKMAEIRDANRVQRGLEGVKEAQGLGRASGYSRVSRLLVPDTLVGTPVYNPAQLSLQNAYLQAEREMQQAAEILAKAQHNFNEMQTPLKGMGALQSEVVRLGPNIAGKEEALKLMKQASPASRLGRFVKGPAGGALGGASALYDTAEAIEHAKKAEYLDALLSGAGAAGGGMSFSKSPRIGAAGLALGVGAPLLQWAKENVQSENRFPWQRPKP